MPYFIIGGYPECKLFNHAKYVGKFLEERLPNFKVKIYEEEKRTWKKWLRELNINNKWNYKESPIIFKELLSGGKKYLLGGLSEFWEYCYDYYALESILPNEELQKLIKDSVQYFNSTKKIKDNTYSPTKSITICITCDHIYTLNMLVTQLLDVKDVFQDMKVTINVFKQIDDVTANKSFVGDHIKYPTNFSYEIIEVNELEEGLVDCDLLIVCGNFNRFKNEEMFTWLNRNYLSMLDLADVLNTNAERKLKVILAMNGPVCFNATVLIAKVTSIGLHNIVALTADYGLETLEVVAKVTDMPVKSFGGPPVWGFAGINHIIDLEHIVQRYEVYRPNIRAVKNNYDSTLRLGTRYTELRFVTYLSEQFDSVFRQINERTVKVDTLQFPCDYAKVRSIISLIRNWLSPKLTENIISLGILSTGAFGIPSKIVFSQPVYFNGNKWVPIRHFPLPRKNPADLHDTLPLIHEILKQFKLHD